MRLIALVAVIVLAGCGPKVVTRFLPNPPPAELSEGWRIVPVSELGASLNAPKEFLSPSEANQTIDLSNVGGEGTAQMTDEHLKNDLHMPDEMIQQRKESEKLPKGTSLLLTKRGNPGETSTTKIELKHKVAQGGTSVEEAASELIAQTMGEGKREPVQLPTGPAIVVSSSTKTRDGQTMTNIHYVMVDNEDVYILSFQTSQPPNVIESIAPKVAASFRLTK